MKKKIGHNDFSFSDYCTAFDDEIRFANYFQPFVIIRNYSILHQNNYIIKMNIMFFLLCGNSKTFEAYNYHNQMDNKTNNNAKTLRSEKKITVR